MIKKIFAKSCFYYMSKGLDALQKNDAEVAKRLQVVPNDTKIKLAILGENESLILIKKQNGFAVSKDKKFDLAISFKFFKSLADIVFGKCSVTESYLNNEFFVQGELRYSVAIVFAIEKFMAYLLPKKVYQKRYEVVPNNAMSKGKMFSKLLFSRRIIE